MLHCEFKSDCKLCACDFVQQMLRTSYRLSANKNERCERRMIMRKLA